MPKLEYFVVAESHAVDRDTNSISIFNVFNDRKYDTFPIVIPQLVAISCWIASPDELIAKTDLQVGIVFRSPGLPDQPYTFNFSSDIEFQHVIIEFNNLRFQKPTVVEVELLLNGNHEATHTIVLRSTDA